MDALDADLAALAATPAPPALARLEAAVAWRLAPAQRQPGWALGSALAGIALVIGLAIGITTPAQPQPAGTGLLLAGTAHLLPSTLLFAGRS
jgi:hypothetical protein